jgi:hypothetical protein
MTGGEPTTSSPRSRRGSCRPSAFTCAENSSSSSTPRSVQERQSPRRHKPQHRRPRHTSGRGWPRSALRPTIDIEEKAAADPKRARGWVAIKGRFGGGTYFVNRTSPTDIVVRAEIMLIPTGTGTTNNVKAIKGMEDAIEKAASTKGYRVDLKFVDVAGPYTFKVNVDPSRWEVATNWSGR